MKMKYIATAFSTVPPDNRGLRKVRKQFFHPNGSPVSEEEVMKAFPHKHQRNDILYSNRGRAWFYCNISGLDQPKLVGTSLFDERTKAAVSLGCSSGFMDDWYYVMQGVEILHSAPLFLLIDVVHGPPEACEIRPVSGTRAVFSNSQCRLEGFMEGISGGVAPGDYKTRFDIGSSIKDRTTLVLTRDPGADWGQFDIALISRAGEEITPNSMQYQGFGGIINFRVPPQKIKCVRITYHPEITRLMIPIKELPGLPDENREVENLLNVRVPYAKFENELEMRIFLGGVLEVMIPIPQSGLSDFPREYENSSAEDILKDYLGLFPKSKVEFDGREYELRIRPRKSWIKKVERILRKYFP